MQITKRAKIMAAAVAVAGAAGMAGVAGSAFTGSGLANSAPASVFVGGTVHQTINGASLSSINYDYFDTTDTTINKVTLSFDSGTAGKTVGIVFTSQTSGFTSVPFTCTTKANTTEGSTQELWECTPTDSNSHGQTGEDGIDVSVS